MNSQFLRGVLLTSTFFILCEPGLSQDADLGLFEASTDVGDVGHPGGAEYDADDETYVVTGGGENMWFDSDAFHFLYKEASGDVALASDVVITGTGGNPHRKAGLILRQSLEPDAPYVDVVVHGDGLTSMQYREVKGGPTREIQSNVTAPRRIRIDREGEYVFMSVARAGEELRGAGGSTRIVLEDPYFVGLAVCAHDNDAREKALFSKVEFIGRTDDAAAEPVLESTLETVSIESMNRRVVFHTRGHIEAPNWSPDGSYLLYNSGGLIYKLPIEGGRPEVLNTGELTRNNNDHGISPDGTQLVVSDQSHEDRQSRIHVLPIEGGTPRLVTELGPSYWHGWSPDGKTLAYVGLRDGDYDIYTIPVDGGEETRLTSAPGLDDGPDYSPDGETIYFNSVRTGTMQIWKMNADGSEQSQVTFDDYNDWFPHPSPDGRWIVFLSYEKDVEGHPANKDVMLRLMPANGGEIQVLAKLFGGQGTINVPSWSPDSEEVAFVSYRLAQP